MKELLIILYKINVAGYTRSQAEQTIINISNAFSLKNDKELKDNYIIREIFLPVEHQSDVKIIYPVPKYTTSPEINDLVIEISNRIKDDPSNVLKNQWERLVRELKLKNIENL